VAHGLEDGIVELDGPGDEQGGVGCLGGHVARSCWLGLVDVDELGLYRDGLLAGYAVTVGVFEVTDALGGEGGVELEGGFVVEVFGQKIEAGLCRRSA
jgi:hypothetical protein